MAKLLIFPDPLEAMCLMAHDSGFQVEGIPDTDFDGRMGQSFEIPEGCPQGHGCTLIISAPNKVNIQQRGILYIKDGVFEYPFYMNRTAAFVADDFFLMDVPDVPVPIPPPNPIPTEPKTPMEVLNAVYATGKYDLKTHEGCGLYTEASVTALHAKWPAFGHLAKSGAQNQFNGHAVDATNLKNSIIDDNGTAIPSGIYDIIFSSAGPDAKPSFNRQGDSDINNWYYPAAPIPK